MTPFLYRDWEPGGAASWIGKEAETVQGATRWLIPGIVLGNVAIGALVAAIAGSGAGVPVADGWSVPPPTPTSIATPSGFAIPNPTTSGDPVGDHARRQSVAAAWSLTRQ